MIQFIRGSLKFSISNLARLHNFVRSLTPISDTQFASWSVIDVTYMIIWEVLVFYILSCFSYLTMRSWRVMAIHYTPRTQHVNQLIIELRLRKFCLNKWVHDYLFSHRLSPTSEGWRLSILSCLSHWVRTCSSCCH